MDISWNEVVSMVLSSFLKLLVAVVIPYLVSLVVKKVKNDHLAKYVQIAGNVVSQCVAYVDQIYVDNLKEDGMFDANAQKKAFEMCKQRIILMLNEEAKSAVIEAYGDFENWLTNAIEYAVRDSKFSFVSDGEPLIEGE
jgi:hypothetical protein